MKKAQITGITGGQDGSYLAELLLSKVTKSTASGRYYSESDFALVCLRNAEAWVLPFSEGITLNRSSFAAAVAHGLPTITTKGTPIETQFVDGENVLLCPPDNPEAIAKTLDRLIDSPDLQRHLRAGALELVHEWFSWDKAIERTVGALRPTR